MKYFITRHFCVFLFSLVFIFPQHSRAQDEGAVAAAVATGILAIGTGVAAINHMKRQAELNATEYFLDNYPEFNQFSMKTLDFEGKKLRDLSMASLITFTVQDFKIVNDEPELQKKFVLLGFTSLGWINEYGIDFNKVLWFLIDRDEWLNMMTAYTKMASGVTNESKIREALKNGKIVNRRIRVKNGDNIDFYKLTDDMYLVADYSEDMKFVYNENALGIYLNETRNLIQIRRKSIINIHDYFFDE